MREQQVLLGAHASPRAASCMPRANSAARRGRRPRRRGRGGRRARAQRAAQLQTAGRGDTERMAGVHGVLLRCVALADSICGAPQTRRRAVRARAAQQREQELDVRERVLGPLARAARAGSAGSDRGSRAASRCARPQRARRAPRAARPIPASSKQRSACEQQLAAQRDPRGHRTGSGRSSAVAAALASRPRRARALRRGVAAHRDAAAATAADRSAASCRRVQEQEQLPAARERGQPKRHAATCAVPVTAPLR